MAHPEKAAAVDSQNLLTLLEAITRETPLPGGATELALLEIDPHRAHVYWQLEPGKVDASRPLYLRVHDITDALSVDQADQTYEIEVHGLQGRWYLDFWRDDRTFVTEIGQHGQSGAFSVLARSNEIHTPPAGSCPAAVSAQMDPLGRPVRTELPMAEPPPEIPAGPSFNKPDAAEFIVSKFAFEEWRHDEQVLEKPAAPRDTVTTSDEATILAAGESAIAVAEEDIIEEWQSGEAFPSIEHILGRQTENRAALAAYYHAVESFPVRTDEPARVSDGGDQESGSAVEIAEEPVPALALEHLMGPSSMDSALRNVLTGLEAELHIRGKVPAGHALTLYGRTLKLNKDGTFSVCRKLMPGSWILPLLFEHGRDNQD